MSDPSNPVAPTAGARPSSVTISSYLLYAVAALQVINAIIGLAYLGKVQDAYRDLYAGTSVEGAETATAIGAIAGTVVLLLIAIGLVVLAVLNNRGKNASRITTWVVGGIGACCLGFGLLGTALSNSMGNAGGDAPSAAEIQQRLDEVLPGWYGPVTNTLTTLALLALLAALILLALPASNQFFRKPQPGHGEPPVPGGTYPGYPQGGGGAPEPGYPSAPGYPSTPGQPTAHPQEPGPRTDRDDKPPSTPPAG
ncbi:hypothetical protein [Plantactinospora sp. GCM10030261]|uniref:hypothetical protein n=1 Tax=Plantactinospora sp. GCM10030261 TaxID=3273420 RepID=UPI0036170C8A